MMRFFLVTAMAAALGACGGSGGDDQTTAQANADRSAVPVRSTEQNQLHQLDEMARNIGLKRAILDSGARCKRVTESGYVTEHDNLSMWSANCADKRSWAIFVGPDGSAQVRPCTQMAQFKLPECRIGKTEKERRGA